MVARQTMALLLGLGVMGTLAFIDYRKLREWAPIFYVGAPSVCSLRCWSWART